MVCPPGATLGSINYGAGTSTCTTVNEKLEGGEMGKSLLSGYTAYASPVEIQRSASNDAQLGDVGTSVSLSVSVSYSLSFSWSFSWSL